RRPGFAVRTDATALVVVAGQGGEGGTDVLDPDGRRCGPRRRRFLREGGRNRGSGREEHRWEYRARPARGERHRQSNEHTSTPTNRPATGAVSRRIGKARAGDRRG